MIVFPPPARVAAVDYLKACAQKNAPKTVHLRKVRQQVLLAYEQYERYVDDPSAAVALALTSDQVSALKRAYEDTLGEKGRARALRDELLMAAREVHRQCPICQSSSIETLDHYLPQSVFAEFSILAINLVPVCGYCNRKKGAAVVDPVTGASYFHHYLDTLPTERLLLARPCFRTGRPPSVEFGLAPPTPTDTREMVRFRHQFVQLRVADRLLGASIDLMLEANESAQELAPKGGAAGVRRYLLRRTKVNQDRYGRNHWLAAMYGGLAGSVDYCNFFGGRPLVTASAAPAVAAPPVRR